MEPGASKKEVLHTPEIMELLLDMFSRLQATEHYIQAKQNHDADAAACTGGDQPPESLHQRAAAQVSLTASSPPCAHETAAAKLSEEVRAMVARRLHRAPILTTSTSKDESDLDAGISVPPRKRQPFKSGNECTADSMVVKKVTWPHELV